MKAEWFVFRPGSRLQQSHAVVWVPEAELQFHWVLPRGQVRIIHASAPTPLNVLGVLEPDGERYLPYPLVRAARRYLKDRTHQRAQITVLQKARERVNDAERRSEHYLQVAASKFLLEKQVAGKEKRTA